MTATAWAQTPTATDTDGYAKAGSVTVPNNPYTCTFSSATDLANAGDTATFTTSSGFTFDISLVDQDLGQYLLADASHGKTSNNTEGGMLSGATSGDVLVINTNNPSAGYTTILPPANDPFAGHRCDGNADFGGVFSGPPGHQSDRNEISGPNGALLVNDTQIWVGDGPSYFTPGQTDSASDYRNDPCDSSVRVFSLITKEQIAHINVGGCFRTDEGAFDAVDQVALIANPSEQDSVQDIDPHAHYVDHAPFVTLISARQRGDHDGDRDRDDSYRILKQINFDGTNGTPKASGGIEQAQYAQQTGLFYIAVPANATTGTGADGYVVTVDPRSGNSFGQVATYALKSGSCPGGPTGMALGPNNEALLGCGGASKLGGQVVVSVTNIAASTANPTILPDGSQSCDEVSYDMGSGHYGGACMTSQTAPGQFALVIDDAQLANTANVAQSFDGFYGAASGAHSIAADWTNAQFWMPKLGGDCGSPTTACVAYYSGNQSDAQGE